ncbi:hypothetical protein [Catenuloplanes japonicus]|uniref:hypothetical protein n=1 Tax=Catenuloplanes japonicus TaxID=33876 RepID=UPI000525F360|nr:hypothetical protein [Catenuloplanes japonicus]
MPSNVDTATGVLRCAGNCGTTIALNASGPIRPVDLPHIRECGWVLVDDAWTCPTCIPAGWPPPTEDHLHVTLAREANSAGLTVTRLMPVDCDHPYEQCFTLQFWKRDGTLWAESQHERASAIRAHIARQRQGIVASLPPRRRRLKACVEAWPEAETGDYDPRCCRFPKSCSASVYADEHVTDADLEDLNAEENR